MASRPNPHQTVTVTIEKLIHDGRGLARHEGLVLFLEDAIPGERVLAEITTSKKGYAEGRILQYLSPSPDRVVPPCPVFGTCGGCQLQQIAYPAQSTLKTEILKDSLQRIGHLPVDTVLPIIPAPHGYGYRRRARLRSVTSDGRPRLGFSQRRSHQVVPIAHCPILHPLLNQALAAVQHALEEDGARATGITEVEFQLAPGGDEILIRFHVEGDGRDLARWMAQRLRQAGGGVPLAGLIVENQAGQRWVKGVAAVTGRFFGIPLRVSARVFSQIHGEMNDCLIAWVVEAAALTGTERVLDLYCGAGNLTFPLAKAASEVWAVDADRAAVKDARANALALGLTHVRVERGPVEEWLMTPAARRLKWDLAVLDPSREGVSSLVLTRLADLAPQKILYVSCDPATLARDLRVLVGRGYHLVRIQPMDFFPQTAHLEAVAELIHQQ